jgi:hypothetical protein
MEGAVLSGRLCAEAIAAALDGGALLTTPRTEGATIPVAADATGLAPV